LIVGIGTDLVEIARIRKAHDRFGGRLAGRLLGPLELEGFAACADSAAFLARRFAAKEAAAKALGTGFQQGLSWTDIQVCHSALGQPQLCWSGRALDRFQGLGAGVQAHISIADERDYALAFVVLERAS